MTDRIEEIINQENCSLCNISIKDFGGKKVIKRDIKGWICQKCADRICEKCGSPLEHVPGLATAARYASGISSDGAQPTSGRDTARMPSALSRPVWNSYWEIPRLESVRKDTFTPSNLKETISKTTHSPIFPIKYKCIKDCS